MSQSFQIPVSVQPPPPPSLPKIKSDGPLIPGLYHWYSTMATLGRKWCPTQSEPLAFGYEAQVWYYDGARTYFQLADFTRDKSWESCALTIAQQYRDYVISNSGGIPGWRVFSRGLRLAYERTGDTRFKDALILLSQKSPWASSGGSVEDQYIRETAYVLNAMVEAERVGASRNPLMDRAVDFLLSDFNRLFVTKTYQIHQTFFDGLAAEALINYYELTHDSRVTPAIKLMLDWLWTYGYDVNRHQMVYNPDPPGPTCADGCQVYGSELMNMVSPAFAWYWRMSGDVRYLARGDEMFAHALETDISYAGKIFSQNYHWSYDYVRWRSNPSSNMAVCTFGISASSAPIPASGGKSTIQIDTNATDCAWTAGSRSSWAVLNPSSGAGPYTDTIAFAPNISPLPRDATITVGDATLTFHQEGYRAPIKIFGTGIASLGLLAAPASIDSHYRLIASADASTPGPNVYVVYPDRFPIGPWMSGSSNGAWIAPQADQSVGLAGGTYRYRTTFDLTGATPSSALLSGAFAADDSVRVELNGIPVGSGAGFLEATPFTIANGFVSGINTLDFIVTNNGSWTSPTGLLVQISGTVSPAAVLAKP